MARRTYESIEEALANGKFDIAQQLLDAGKALPSIAEFFFADDEDRMLARDARAVIWLAEHGAPCDVVAKDGLTAVALAARNGNYAVVDALLEHGASVGPGPNGNTPLHGSVALEWCNDPIWDRLIEAGNALEARNDDDETPLSLAQHEWNWMAIVNFVKHGAKHDVVVNGKTPLERAIAKKQTKIIKRLAPLAAGGALVAKGKPAKATPAKRTKAPKATPAKRAKATPAKARRR